jgi:putative ribosome biogenesis GTPase RsgA
MGSVEDVTENAQVDTDLSEDATYEATDVTDKIRLVILGRCGTGKSTIVSRVFGISEEEVSASLGL